MFAPSTLLGVVTSLALLAAPASARTWAGPVDMMVACTQQYGGGWKAIKNGNGGNDWRCVDSQGTQKHINVDAYCSQTYGNAAYSDPQGGGAYDWGCYFR